MAMQPISDKDKYMLQSSGRDLYTYKKKKKMSKHFTEWLEENHADDTDTIETAKQVLQEKYIGFDKLKAKIGAKGGVKNPGAVAAAIGRKKYGKSKFQHAAAKGKKMRGMKKS